MQSTFVVTVDSTSVTLDSQGQGTVTFIATNSTDHPVDAHAEIVAWDAALQPYLHLRGNAQRHFAPHGSEHYPVVVDAPPTMHAGDYRFRLRMVEDTIEVGSPPPVSGEPRSEISIPRWAIPAAVILLLLVVVISAAVGRAVAPALVTVIPTFAPTLAVALPTATPPISVAQTEVPSATDTNTATSTDTPSPTSTPMPTFTRTSTPLPFTPLTAANFMSAKNVGRLSGNAGHQFPVTSLAFSRDSRWLASGDAQGNILIHDAYTRSPIPLNQMTVGNSAVTNLSFDSTAGHLAGTISQKIFICDLQKLPVDCSNRLNVSADYVVFGGNSNLISFLSDGSGQMWDTTQTPPVRAKTMNFGMPISTFAISADGRFVAGAARNTGRVSILDLTSGGNSLPRPSGAGFSLNSITDLAFTPDNNWVYSSSRSGVLSLQDIHGNSAPAPSLSISSIAGISFGHDSNLIAFYSGMDSNIYLSNLSGQSGHWLMQLSGSPGNVNNLLFSPDGSVIASTSSSGNDIYLWGLTANVGQ